MRRLFRPLPLTLAALLGLASYALFGFFLLPYLITTYGVPKAAEMIRHPIVVKEVAVNPFDLSLKLTGLEVRALDESAMVGFEEFFVDVQGTALLRGIYGFDEIRLRMPYASVKIDPSGHLNLLDLIPPAPAEPAPSGEAAPAQSGIPAVEIGLFEMTQGIVELRDESTATPVSLDIVPLNITLRQFHTKPGGDNTYAFMAELGKGEILEWKGTCLLEPIRSEGEIAIHGVKLSTLFQYVQDQFRFTLPSGTLEAQAAYRFDLSEGPTGLHVSDASFTVRDVAVTERGALDPVVEVGAFAVNGIGLDLAKRAVTIEGMTLDRTTTQVWLNPDKTVNLASVFAPAQVGRSSTPAPAPDAAKPASDSGWTVALKDFQNRQHTIVFEDRSIPGPMRGTITITSLRTHDVGWPLRGAVPIVLDQLINETASLHVEGALTPAPFQADVTLALKHLALAPFEPYLAQTTDIGIDDGLLDVAGSLHVAMDHPKAPFVTFKGNLGIASLAVVNRADEQPVVGWKQLALKNIAATVDPLSVTLEELALDQPRVYLRRQADESLNLSHLVKEQAATLPPVEKPAAPAPAPPIAVGAVRLSKGAVVFQDEAIHPAVRTQLQDLTGTIKGLSSKQVAKADVELTGRLDGVAPLKIAGKINPLSEDAYTDLTVKFENIDLSTASSYSGKYAGYPIRKGKLFLDLAYKLSQKDLAAENAVLIDQLGFGDKTESPDATSLPVPLIVALLKDRKGQITIDLPIRGNLADPDFKYGRVLLNTLLNLLGKAATSPFALVGALVGGSGEELQGLECAPGRATWSEPEGKKLSTLATVLTERPGLSLDIAGGVDPQTDGPVLAEEQVMARLRQLKQEEQGGSGGKGTPPVLTAEDEARLITRWYETQFPASEAKGGAVRPAVADMKARLIATVSIGDDAWRRLAQQRAEQVRDWLIHEGHVEDTRIFLVESGAPGTGKTELRLAAR